MPDPLPSPDECLVGARLCLANARSLYLASRSLRRHGHNREAVLLLTTSVEEAAKSGMLQRAWLFRDNEEAHTAIIRAWRDMSAGGQAHARKIEAAHHVGNTTMTLAMFFAIVADFISHDHGSSATENVLDLLVGRKRLPATGWYATLWDERQRVYVDWADGRWTAPADAGAFYDDGQRQVLMLLANLRRDLRVSRAD